MFRQILVPLDGSEQAERAVPLAARLVRRTDGTVTLMRVVGAVAARGSEAVPVRTGEHAAAPCDRASAAAYLRQLGQHPELAGISTDVVVRDGDPAEQIVTEVERRAADLIVLSHRRHGPTAAFFAGSIADAVMRRSPVPVLVLHAGSLTEFPDRRAGMRSWPVQALVPLDGSALAETAIPFALELLRLFDDGRGSSLHLTYILDPKQAYQSGTPETTAMHEARIYLESVAKRISADASWGSAAVTWKVEPEANVMTGIERVAEQGASLRGDTFDFVAMATHGREGIARLLAGSVTEALVHDVHVPVLIVHRQQEPSTHGRQQTGAAGRDHGTGAVAGPVLK